jgi:flagellar basal body-associated protein FliL
MKQKDIILIVIVVFFSALISFFVSTALFGSSKTNQQQAEVVQPITSSFPKPDERFFNDQAFDPTQPITIGQDTNPSPFSSQ